MSKDIPAPMDLETIDNFAWAVLRGLNLVNPIKTKKTLLSIGSRPNANDYMVKFFIQQGWDVTILEIFQPYIEQLRANGLKVIQGDVRKVDEIIKETFDVVMWWHGPEHVDILEIGPIADKLKAITRDRLIFCCPWGENHSGDVDGNEANSHKSYIEPMNFLGWGMKEYHYAMSGVPNAVIIGHWPK